MKKVSGYDWQEPGVIQPHPFSNAIRIVGIPKLSGRIFKIVHDANIGSLRVWPVRTMLRDRGGSYQTFVSMSKSFINHGSHRRHALDDLSALRTPKCVSAIRVLKVCKWILGGHIG